MARHIQRCFELKPHLRPTVPPKPKSSANKSKSEEQAMTITLSSTQEAQVIKIHRPFLRTKHIVFNFTLSADQGDF